MGQFLININGQIFTEETAKISVFDRGFLYGDSVYEATRTFNKRPFRLNDHLDRLFNSAYKIDLLPTLNRDEIEREILKTIEASSFCDALLRIILTRGTNRDLGLDPDLSSDNNLIIITKEITPNPDWWYKVGLSLTFYDKKNSVRGALPKSGNYQENILAHRLALSVNAYDAIMVNDDGHITECTTSNFWLIKDGIIYTPPLKDGLLEGLTRKTLLEISKVDRRFPMIEKSLTRSEAFSADECFISSTTRNLVPVTKIEGHSVGPGLPGTQTMELLSAYMSYVLGK